MEQTQKHGAAGLVLKWILLIAADIAVVVLIPILFVYTQSAPVTPVIRITQGTMQAITQAAGR